MSETEMQDELVRRFVESSELGEELVDEGEVFVEGVCTFADVGLLTGNAGVVVRCSTGDEFQLTIVQSRCAS